MVVPHEGTWIEIYPPFSWPLSLPSFPTRERGLKWQCSGECHRDPGSFPTRERGLKFPAAWQCILPDPVVPHEGTWIEMLISRDVAS